MCVHPNLVGYLKEMPVDRKKILLNVITSKLLKIKYKKENKEKKSSSS